MGGERRRREGGGGGGEEAEVYLPEGEVLRAPLVPVLAHTVIAAQLEGGLKSNFSYITLYTSTPTPPTSFISCSLMPSLLPSYVCRHRWCEGGGPVWWQGQGMITSLIVHLHLQLNCLRLARCRWCRCRCRSHTYTSTYTWLVLDS